MIYRIYKCSISLACMLFAVGWISAAHAANLSELNFWLSGPNYEAIVPLCDEPGPLYKIQHRFGVKEDRFWNSNLEILGFEKIREVSFRPWASASIPRRFCKALALVSDGTKRPVFYSIVEDGGMIGGTYGVEWCVVGLDREWAYNPKCRMALP